MRDSERRDKQRGIIPCKGINVGRASCKEQLADCDARRHTSGAVASERRDKQLGIIPRIKA